MIRHPSDVELYFSSADSRGLCALRRIQVVTVQRDIERAAGDVFFEFFRKQFAEPPGKNLAAAADTDNRKLRVWRAFAQ